MARKFWWCDSTFDRIALQFDIKTVLVLTFGRWTNGFSCRDLGSYLSPLFPRPKVTKLGRLVISDFTRAGCLWIIPAYILPASANNQSGLQKLTNCVTLAFLNWEFEIMDIWYLVVSIYLSKCSVRRTLPNNAPWCSWAHPRYVGLRGWLWWTILWLEWLTLPTDLMSRSRRMTSPASSIKEHPVDGQWYNFRNGRCVIPENGGIRPTGSA